MFPLRKLCCVSKELFESHEIFQRNLAKPIIINRFSTYTLIVRFGELVIDKSQNFTKNYQQIKILAFRKSDVYVRNGLMQKILKHAVISIELKTRFSFKPKKKIFERNKFLCEKKLDDVNHASSPQQPITSFELAVFEKNQK